jgi:hypothetical protein
MGPHSFSLRRKSPSKQTSKSKSCSVVSKGFALNFNFNLILPNVTYQQCDIPGGAPGLWNHSDLGANLDLSLSIYLYVFGQMAFARSLNLHFFLLTQFLRVHMRTE